MNISLSFMSVPDLVMQTAVLAGLVLLYSQWKKEAVRTLYVLWYLVILRAMLPFRIELTAPSFSSLPFQGSAGFLRFSEISVIAGSKGIIEILPAAWIFIVLLLITVRVYREIRFRKYLTPVRPGAELLERIPEKFSHIPLFLSDGINSPISYGIIHPRIVLPLNAHTMSDGTLEAVIAHEAAHIRRRDILHNVIREIAAVIWFFNPVIRYAGRRCLAYQEMICDSEGLDSSSLNSEKYSEMLIEYAQAMNRGFQAGPLTVSGLQGIKGVLEKRLLFISRFYHKGGTMTMRLRLPALTVLFALILVASSSISDLSAAEDLTAASELEAGDEPVFVEYDTPPRPVGGIQAILNNVVYPEKAREDQIEGTVVVQVYIGPDGRVGNSKLLKSVPGTGLDEAAVAALGKTLFEPAMFKGQPLGVWIAVPIVFKLQ